MNRLVKLVAFLVIPGLNAVTPLIAIPAITATHGVEGWEAYALGMSIGSSAAVVVELGWPLTGPQRVAAQRGGERWATFVSSVRTRLLAFLLVAPLATIAGVLLARTAQVDEVSTTALMSLASVSVGLSGNWYFIGTSRPMRILGSEALPRALLITAGSVAVLAGARLETVPLFYLLSAIFSLVAGTLIARADRESRVRFTLAEDWRVIRSQFAAMGVRTAGALYTALPITLVGVFAPSALAAFAAVERLMRMWLSLLQAVPNMLQNWLGSAAGPDERRYRATRSILISGGVGVFAGALLAVGMPLIAPLLFQGAVDVPWSLAVLSSIVVVLVCISRASGALALVAYRRVPALTISTSIGAVVGVSTISILAAIGGAAGAFVGEIIAGVVVAAIELLVLRAAIRSERVRPRRALPSDRSASPPISRAQPRRGLAPVPWRGR